MAAKEAVFLGEIKRSMSTVRRDPPAGGEGKGLVEKKELVIDTAA